MNDDEAAIGASYGLASLCLQMALMNSLAGQGGVPATAITALIAKARMAPRVLAGDASPELLALTEAVIDQVARNWATMQVRN